MKVMAEGAEAVVYETELNRMKVLVKRRVKKDYRVNEMDTRIRTQRSRNEARIIAMVSKAGINAPKLLLFDGYDIYMTALQGKKLTDVIARGASGALFEEVGRMLARLHRLGVAHGDYTPANIIVGNNGAGVIDFGLSEITGSVEEKALDVLLMKRSIPNGFYRSFKRGYEAGNSNAPEVLGRLAMIERRGRYQTRTLS
jgi:Kae1-associated kinase Bud32